MLSVAFDTSVLREHISEFMNFHHALDVPLMILPEHVSVVGGEKALNQKLARCLIDEGEGVLLGRPSDPAFQKDWGATTG